MHAGFDDRAITQIKHLGFFTAATDRRQIGVAQVDTTRPLSSVADRDLRSAASALSKALAGPQNNAPNDPFSLLRPQQPLGLSPRPASPQKPGLLTRFTRQTGVGSRKYRQNRHYRVDLGADGKDG